MMLCKVHSEVASCCIFGHGYIHIYLVLHSSLQSLRPPLLLHLVLPRRLHRPLHQPPALFPSPLLPLLPSQSPLLPLLPSQSPLLPPLPSPSPLLPPHLSPSLPQSLQRLLSPSLRPPQSLRLSQRLQWRQPQPSKLLLRPRSSACLPLKSLPRHQRLLRPRRFRRPRMK